MDAGRLARDGGEHDLGRRDGKVVTMMFADAKDVDAVLVGEDAFVDDVADDCGLGFRGAVGALGDVAEGIQTQFEGTTHIASFVVETVQC